MTTEQQVVEIVNKLQKFSDSFISDHGIEKAREKKKLVKAELMKSLEEVKLLEPTCEKTTYLLQYGRALNILPEYNKECEDCLSKVVKRDPSLIEAWNLLGETFWKKSDNLAAKDCFEGSLKREKNKIALRSLSMVLRQVKCTKSEEAISNVIKSVDLAKMSVDIDKNDGMSWFVLGNAYLSLFFASDQSAQTLLMAMTSYFQAEKVDTRSSYNPDLHFNMAQAYRYEESYTKAFKGWQQALKLDPEWNEPKIRTNELMCYLIKVNNLVEQRGKLKAKRLHGFIKSIDEKALGPLSPKSLADKNIKLDNVKLSELQEGRNADKLVVGKVVCNFADVAQLPFTFAMVDSNGECCAVTVYNLAQGKGVIIGDSVAVPEPFFSKVDLTLLDKDSTQCAFSSIRVNTPDSLIVNGKKLSSEHCAFAKASMNRREM
ncbi:tetratricopeptide repeat protein 5-like [Styela clava]|uniref:tetratricopeptide repeat protein 5-like n=1 Tax=Styela clava TaxID=7725 RepID=UPI0019393379|nr:tetratricopeptide repeat protein 5-like [Styela clava]